MMKSCVIESSAETQLNLHCMDAYALLEDNFFATVPVSVVRPVSVERRAVEEELHALFEEAISERVAAVSRQLSLLPRSTTDVHLLAQDDCSGKVGGRFFPCSVVLARVNRFWRDRRHALTLLCLGLNLLLLGFDCMGLLVLAR